MDISRLLNPAPGKRRRFDILLPLPIHSASWLPTEIIGYILAFIDSHPRPTFRLVSKSWYNAYKLYHRHSFFSFGRHVCGQKLTRRQLLSAFAKHGRRIRFLEGSTDFLRDMLEAEPNFAGLVPNIQRISLAITDGFPSRRWVGEVVARLTEVREIALMEYGFQPDEQLAIELDAAIANMPRFKHLETFSLDLDATQCPGPNMKAVAHRVEWLEIPISNIESGTVAATFGAFSNIRVLGMSSIGSMEVLAEVADVLTEPTNFPSMFQLYVFAELDITRTEPIVSEDTSTPTTAMMLFERICRIRRPRFELNLGFILGACSTTDAELIAREREFIINLGKNHSDVLTGLQLTHFAPSGDYDPLSALFYESVPRLPRLAYMRFYITPTAVTAPKLITAFNNEFLLPNLTFLEFYVDSVQVPEWIEGHNPLNASRGAYFGLVEIEKVDRRRMENESNGGVIESAFQPDSDSWS